MIGKTINDLKIGDTASYTKTITEQDVALFGEVSGDMNPAHFDEEYAKNSIFKTRVAHGMLCGSLFSTVLGTELPGYGTIYLSQDLKFIRPVYFNDTITAKVTVSEFIFEKNRVILETIATNQNDEVVITGKAVVMPPQKK